MANEINKHVKVVYSRLRRKNIKLDNPTETIKTMLESYETIDADVLNEVTDKLTGSIESGAKDEKTEDSSLFITQDDEVEVETEDSSLFITQDDEKTEVEVEVETKTEDSSLFIPDPQPDPETEDSSLFIPDPQPSSLTISQSKMIVLEAAEELNIDLDSTAIKQIAHDFISKYDGIQDQSALVIAAIQSYIDFNANESDKKFNQSIQSFLQFSEATVKRSNRSRTETLTQAQDAVTEWSKRTKQRGNEAFDKLINDLENETPGFKFPR